MITAQAEVRTEKASRYLKALCNHFSHKVTAQYDDNRGNVQFGFGNCEMQASADVLVIKIEAEDEDNFARVKHVLADHLERFGTAESLQVVWIEPA